MIGWIASILCIIGNIAVIKRKNGFLIWFVGTGILLILSLLRQDWSQVFLFFIYEILNISGYLSWKNEKKNKKEYLK